MSNLRSIVYSVAGTVLAAVLVGAGGGFLEMQEVVAVVQEKTRGCDETLRDLKDEALQMRLELTRLNVERTLRGLVSGGEGR